MTSASDEQGPSYDLVVVGAGASACGLLYGILRRHIVSSSSGAENNEHKQPAARVEPLPFTIAVLDRGASASSPYRSKPTDWFRASHSRCDGAAANRTDRTPTLLQTIPQVGLGNRIIDVPIGDGLGGSTNINACLVAAPSQRDFDDWPEEFSGSKMVGAANHISRAMRNNDGIELTTFNEANNICEEATPTMSSLDPAQFPSKVDRVATASRKAGSGDLHTRVNYFDSLIRPLLEEYPQLRQYVTFLEGFDVQRILLEEERNEKDDCVSVPCRAAGVECNTITGGTVQIRARKELILCAGAILSPALLMVSGIGPQDILSNQGISLPRNITAPPPGWNAVGKGLTDHVVLPRAFLTLPRKWRSKSVSGIQSWDNATCTDEQSLYQLTITDGMCSTQLIPHFVAAFLRRCASEMPSNERQNRYQAWNGIVDASWAITFRIVRFILQLLLVWTPLGLIAKHCTATINISLLNPVSKGCVTIHRRIKCSSSPARLEEFNIVVDPCYLRAARDMKAIEHGWQLSEMVRAKHFASCLEILPNFVYPLAKRFSDFFYFGTRQKDWIFQFASDFSCPYFHWNGTCAMGRKAGASVVNSRLEVGGINGLRVCDASVFASNVSCPPALTCTCLGYVASNFIHSELQ